MFRGAKSCVVDKELHTPLLCAAIREYHEVCEVFINHKASIEDVDAKGKNIINIAAEKNYSTLLEVPFLTIDIRLVVCQRIHKKKPSFTNVNDVVYKAFFFSFISLT